MKLVVPALVFVVALVFYFATRRAPEKTEIESSTNRPATTQVSAIRPPPTSSIQTNPVQPGKIVFATNTNDGQESIEKQIEALTDASMKSDSKSLQLIVGAFTNAKVEIRKAAVEAAIQFGSRDAIPFLEDAAEKTDDAREKVDILDAIDFLKLPTLSEVRPLRRQSDSKNLRK
jgi:hypothetical protein